MGIQTKKARGKNSWVVFTVFGQGKNSGVYPSAKIRRAIAPNLNEIESYIGTRFTRTKGRIVAPIGAGAWGVVFKLEDGTCLKVSTDPVEGANALFFMKAQAKQPSLLDGTAKIYNVFKIKNRQNILFSCVHREYVDIPRSFSKIIQGGLEIYQDNMIFF